MFTVLDWVKVVFPPASRPQGITGDVGVAVLALREVFTKSLPKIPLGTVSEYSPLALVVVVIAFSLSRPAY
jgi:hypothetical protein